MKGIILAGGAGTRLYPLAASNATTATKKAAQKKRFIEENASSYSVFSFYQKRCSDVPSWFILFVL